MVGGNIEANTIILNDIDGNMIKFLKILYTEDIEKYLNL